MTWETQIFLKPEIDREKIKEKCEGIFNKDPTFIWKIEEDYLIVESPNYPQAKARGMKLVKQYFKELENMGFEVKKVETGQTT
jgi:hypothetical protein